MKVNKKSFIFAIAALAIAGAAPMAGATENCEHGLQVGAVDGTTVKIKNSDRAYVVEADKAEHVKVWSEGSHLRLCGDELTNISFRSLPTFKVTVAGATVEVPVAEATEQPAPEVVAEPTTQEPTQVQESQATEPVADSEPVEEVKAPEAEDKPVQ